MTEDIQDFGFTTYNFDELQSQLGADVKDEEIAKIKFAFDQYNKVVQNFLQNLRKNPEKEYIYWKDRDSKVAAFQRKLIELKNYENS